MSEKTDKRARAGLFRSRLAAAIEQSRSSQSALARAAGVDRSTISQLLRDTGPRLPNGQLVAECAASLGVSADWLLGLSDRPEQAQDLMAASMTVTEAPRALIDEQIFAWHREARGYKIRHVPAGLPDMLKTTEMLRWEYEPSLGRTTDQAIGASEDRLNWMRAARSDYEIALPVHDLQAMANADGYYRDLPREIRVGQLDRLADLHDQLYPSLRIYLFDARRLFSAPITIFGPLLAVIYLGSNYLAFRDAARVDTFTRHFDTLIRQAQIASREFPAHIAALRASL
ncbi:MAG: helix-turn-helix transcriptional regulator [Pseudomonadota bacterium]